MVNSGERNLNLATIAKEPSQIYTFRRRVQQNLRGSVCEGVKRRYQEQLKASGSLASIKLRNQSLSSDNPFYRDTNLPVIEKP
jgi:hypothetical protein